MARPLSIGLTGGIASGKSTVSRLFEALGVTVIDTDIIARELVQPGQPALQQIRAAFGDTVFSADGTLDRSALRRCVFSDQAARHRLEAILHPKIELETQRQMDAAGGDYLVVVIPLLNESPLREQLDRILVVDCDEDTQIKRLLARDAESDEQARRILASQPSREQRLAIADDIIHNDLDVESLSTQVSALHDSYTALAHLPAG
ncbi:MAG: dephospho-CoA kinase [Gammaproteobacteria bacterium]|nr:dephospho-CoA kinase [Gammaproteobacteria bacterium]MDH5303436.1 dephospho-CoA kinase [Gammaproteobacteria bacterium]MDH5321827.1 dephospho-CoA kinase [Gammaproteobacteria bacterium]